MPAINTIDELRKWLRKCPVLSDSNRFRVNYLGKNATEYGINSEAAPLNYVQNVLGERRLAKKQTARYTFKVKFPYGADIQQNIENVGACTDISTWIIDQSNKGNLPEIAEGELEAINPTFTPYPAELDEKTATYYITFEMPYKIKG